MTFKTKGRFLAATGVLLAAAFFLSVAVFITRLGQTDDRDWGLPVLAVLILMLGWIDTCHRFLLAREAGYIRCTCGRPLVRQLHLCTRTHSVGKCEGCGAYWECEKVKPHEVRSDA